MKRPELLGGFERNGRRSHTAFTGCVGGGGEGQRQPSVQDRQSKKTCTSDSQAPRSIVSMLLRRFSGSIEQGPGISLPYLWFDKKRSEQGCQCTAYTQNRLKIDCLLQLILWLFYIGLRP